MKKVSCAAVAAALLLVVTMPARAADGRAFHGTPPSARAVVVSPKMPKAVAPPYHRPVVVAPHHGFVHPRAFAGVGAPFWWPGYAYPAYAYGPPTQVYALPDPAYWYYCQEAGAYYPDVQECPGGWLTVTPQPAQ